MLPSVRLILQEETHLARKLLYQVYVQEMKWNVNKHTNPSKLRADHELGELIDVFDEPEMQQHCHWIGKFEDSKLTAVLRVISEHNGGWELTRYGEEKVPEFIRRQGPCVEVNRLAVHPNNRGKNTARTMLPFLISYSRDLGARLAFASVVEKNKRHIKSLGLYFHPEVPRFKYNDYDDNYCHLIVHHLYPSDEEKGSVVTIIH